MKDLKPITAAELGWGEADGAISINTGAVAERLNALLRRIERLERSAGRCECMNCIVVGCRP
jgi:hypothetical protein